LINDAGLTNESFLNLVIKRKIICRIGSYPVYPVLNLHFLKQRQRAHPFPLGSLVVPLQAFNIPSASTMPRASILLTDQRLSCISVGILTARNDIWMVYFIYCRAVRMKISAFVTVASMVAGAISTPLARVRYLQSLRTGGQNTSVNHSLFPFLIHG